MRVGCFREFQNSIDDSVYSLLVDEIDRLELPGFGVLGTEINHESGGEMRFRGLARNPGSMKSMHGFNRFWIEEAQTISDQSLKLLIPTLREEESEIWMSANPMSRADPFSVRFIEPFAKELERDGYFEDDLHIVVVINHCDNPCFPAVLEADRKKDREILSSAEYEHIWLGRYNDTIENSIIPVEWFDAAIDAHKKLGFKPTGAKYVAHDPSDMGKDPKGLCLRHGSVILDVQEKQDGDSNQGCEWATNYALSVRANHFIWDCDGLGVSLKRQVSQALKDTQTDYHMYKGSESPDDPEEPYQHEGSDHRTNKQTFKNKRAQYYWKARDRFEATHRAVTRNEYIDPEELISLSSDISTLNQLRAELCRIPKKPNPNGLIQIMTKEEMLSKYKISSPNLADSLMMSLYTEDKHPVMDMRYHDRSYSGAGSWMR